MSDNRGVDVNRSAQGGHDGSRNQRREIYYSGRVQGVGFRYTARSIASDLPVVGTVRNLPDGRVHLTVEGETSAVDELLSRIDGELGRYIRGKEMSAPQPSGEFSSFDIVH